MNRVILEGNLGADPVLRFTAGGQMVTDLRLATNESYSDKEGKRHQAVEWHAVVVWGKSAKSCTDYLKKGRRVTVEGKLRTRSWDDKTTGKKQYKTEVIASHVDFGPAKKTEEQPVTT